MAGKNLKMFRKDTGESLTFPLISENFAYTNKIPEKAVDFNSPVTDHIQLQNDKVTVRTVVSEANISSHNATDTFKIPPAGPEHVNAYIAFLKEGQQRSFLVETSRYGGTYEEMAIAAVNFSTGNQSAVYIEIQFQQISVASPQFALAKKLPASTARKFKPVVNQGECVCPPETPSTVSAQEAAAVNKAESDAFLIRLSQLNNVRI